MLIRGTPLFSKLFNALTSCYNREGMKYLCGVLGVPADMIVVAEKPVTEAALALIEYCDMRGKADSLIEAIIETRADCDAVKAIIIIMTQRNEGTNKEQRVLQSLGSSAPQGIVTICFTDIEGSSAYSQRMDEAAVRQLIKEHNEIIRRCLKRHKGQEVHPTGDGFMAVFLSPKDAVLCSLNIQCEFALWNVANRHRQVRVRISLNTGEVISENGDYSGNTTANAAARICVLAKGGQVLLSESTKNLSQGSLDIHFIDFGLHKLRNIEGEYHLYTVEWH